MLSAVETARQALCKMIASGRLKTGQVLPTEAELCAEFGVSRSSLREAQKMLVTAGVLTAVRGARPAVSQMSPTQIMTSMKMVIPLLPLDRFVEFFTLRQILEGYCAAQAAARFSKAQIADLGELVRELADCPPGDRAQILDSQFHKLIIDGAKDQVISALLSAIRRRGRDYHVFEVPQYSHLKDVSDQAHLAIYRAIEQRDPERARFLAMEHVETTRNWLLEFRPEPELFEAGE